MPAPLTDAMIEAGATAICEQFAALTVAQLVKDGAEAHIVRWPLIDAAQKAAWRIVFKAGWEAARKVEPRILVLPGDEDFGDSAQ